MKTENKQLGYHIHPSQKYTSIHQLYILGFFFFTVYLADILVLCYNPPGKMCNTHFPIKATWTWVLAGFRLIKCCFSFLCVYFCKQCLLFILQIIKRNLNNQNQTKPIHRNREELHNYATGLSRILFGQHACLSRVVEIQRHSPACRMLIVLKKKSKWLNWEYKLQS